MRIMLRAQDLQPVILCVQPGAALLVGRQPDPERAGLRRGGLATAAAAAGLLVGCRVETVRIDSARLAANHLLVRRGPDGVELCELGTRPGAWLRLSAGQALTVAGPLEVALAPEPAGRPAGEPGAEPGAAPAAGETGPADADFLQAPGLGGAVVAVLSEWLAGQGVHAEVRLGGPGGGDESSFTLSDHTVLRVRRRLRTTAPGAWPAVLAQVRAYVQAQNARYDEFQRRTGGMILASRGLREAVRRVADAAAQRRRTILLGETGVGKDKLARCYHLYSPRRDGPFLALNCALLDRELLYAQIFGARRGSFTGAVSDVVGVLEAADGGTLFLDELGEMSADVQKGLLRFLDSHGEYQRLGDPHPRRADVQIVCASNVPLGDPAARAGRFRDDLWYRLAASVVQVPPLRERREDILSFLQARTAHGTAIPVAEALSPEALSRVLADPWPGNFRDLDNFVERLQLPPGATLPLPLSACEAALHEGRASRRRADEPAARGPGPGPGHGSGPAVRRPRLSDPALAALLDWRALASTAVEAFIEDQGREPASWGQIQEFVEKYLKPVFVAQASGVRSLDLDDAGRPLNYSALARRLSIADGSTVKLHLGRYAERFQAPRATGAQDGSDSDRSR